MSSNAIINWLERTMAGGHRVRSIRKVHDHYLEIVESEESGKKMFALLRQPTVVIVPVIRLEGKKYTLLIEEYCVGAREKVLSFPFESIRPDEEIVSAARRTLFKETSVPQSSRLKFQILDLGEKSYISATASNETLHLVKIEIQLPSGFGFQQLHGKMIQEKGEEEIQTVVKELNLSLMKQVESISDKLGVMIVGKC